MEFALNLSSAAPPNGFAAIGASCGPHHDSAVLLINDAQFQVLQGIGETTVGNFSLLPYISNGLPPATASGSMCIASNSTISGSRPYAGALLEHKVTNRQLCAV